MVIALRNFYLYRTHVGLLSAEKQFNGLLQRNCVRQKRGSRKSGKGGDILKCLLENLDGFTKTIAATGICDDHTKAIEDQYKKLEEKITPLKNETYPHQLEKKRKLSMGILRYLGEKLHSLSVPICLDKSNLPCPVDLTVKSPLLESYRNQDEFSIGLGPDGNPKTVGFYVGNDDENKLCISPERLSIIKESHKQFTTDFQNYLKDSPLAANVEYDDGGYWRGLKIRSNTTGDLMGIITMNPQELSKKKLIEEADKLREYFLAQKPYYLKSLFLQIGEQNINNPNFKLDLLFGDSYIVETLKNKKFQVSPGSYFPSNTKGMEELYNSIMKVCQIDKETTILDIFCGTGPLSLTMSPLIKKSIGIDNCSSNIQDARANAVCNGIENAKFTAGDMEVLINQILLGNDYHNKLIAVINPARTELTRAAINSLRTCKYLTKIIYITTIPKSAVANYIRLCKPAGSSHYLGKSFVPLLAIPVDLFPHTNRYGLVVMFQRW